MLESTVQGIKFIISSTWSIFTGVTFPGTEFTFAQIAIGCMVITFSMRILGMVLGVHVDSGELDAKVEEVYYSRNKVGKIGF